MLALLATVEHADKTAWYVVGGLLAAWAVLLASLGITRPAFPQGDAGGRTVMAISTVLVLAAMAAAVLSD